MVVLILILFWATRDRVLALQLTLSLILMLPELPLLPLLLWIVTLPPARLFESVAPVMSPPLAATVKSTGSISQLPLAPLWARVVMCASLATVTCAALVSMVPPLPPSGALASSVPPTLTLPLCMSPSSRMTPPTFCSVRASTMPLLLTTAAASASAAGAACAARTTWPPSATISCWLFTSALKAP